MSITQTQLVYALMDPEPAVRKWWRGFLGRVHWEALNLRCPVCPAGVGQECLDAGLPVHREREEATDLYRSEIAPCEHCGDWHAENASSECWRDRNQEVAQ